MSDEVSIMVKIADKEYPLKVSSTEIELVRRSEKEIEDKINELKGNYNVRHSQDIMAMTLLQLLVEKNQKLMDNTGSDSGIYEKLSELESFVSDYIKST